ncbi:U box domain containing protein [Klebsormidium nitens]|uniref:U box domain containing protein n=1 Tax=Klebsormidium nitens TaxID=105231 RepID=A0A0U9HKI8_KLENI|nr:U box domain containing protein [Klebsormidium nitens]|eukprot:GAQ88943.1 U box domain containing protein [Klebsormidium nitens]
MGSRGLKTKELFKDAGMHREARFIVATRICRYLLSLSFLSGNFSALLCFFLSGIAAFFFATFILVLSPLYTAAILLTLPFWAPLLATFLAFCATFVTHLLSLVAVSLCGAFWVYASFRIQRGAPAIPQRSDGPEEPPIFVREIPPALSNFVEMLECPITRQIMRDPVIATDGFTYERSAIAAWLARSPTSPMTNLRLPGDWWQLIPNRTVKAQVAEWREMQQTRAKEERTSDFALRRLVKKVASAAGSVDTLLFGRLEEL